MKNRQTVSTTVCCSCCWWLLQVWSCWNLQMVIW